jgi:hypothetical protein
LSSSDTAMDATGTPPSRGRETEVQINTRSRAFAIAAAATLLALSMSVGVGSVLGKQDARMAENTFTKWVTSFPSMAGFVGGDVGAGAYAGEVLSLSGSATPADPLLITADYHFIGAHHSFTARLNIVQVYADAQLNGVVTKGWLKGNVARGAYTMITCAHDGGTSDCFQGYLDILRGTK